MFTPEQRDALRDRVLALAAADERAVAGAAVGSLAERGAPAPTAGDLFDWGVVYALHARVCIERGRTWQAEHDIGEVRDHALALPCLRHGVPAVQARGYDDLPPEVLAGFAASHVGSVAAEALRSALAAAIAVRTPARPRPPAAPGARRPRSPVRP